MSVSVTSIESGFAQSNIVPDNTLAIKCEANVPRCGQGCKYFRLST
ncbi:hypothetical protein [Plectonema radiosum]|nr:hypothetical protein [Plectonema radiosum]